jgi:hypothetical protein
MANANTHGPAQPSGTLLSMTSHSSHFVISASHAHRARSAAADAATRTTTSSRIRTFDSWLWGKDSNLRLMVQGHPFYL